MRAWVSVGIMMFVIIISLPLAPVLWKAGLKTFGPIFNSIGYGIFGGILVGLALHMVRDRSGFGALRPLSLFGLAIVYLFLLRYLCRYPADRIHFVEYGLLAYLAYRPFRIDFSNTKAYIFGFLVATGFGVLDEGIQYLLPNRVFEMRDVVTNAAACVLGLLVVAVLRKPASSKGAVHEAGICS